MRFPRLTGVILNGCAPKLTRTSQDFKQTCAKNVFSCNGRGISNASPRSLPKHKILFIYFDKIFSN
jgi:hypothetical protein